MNIKEAREIIAFWYKVPPKEAIERAARMVFLNQSIGFLKAAEKAEKLLNALEKFRSELSKFESRQRNLLVKNQSLESASRNWAEFPEAFQFDLEPIFKAVSDYKREMGI